VAGTTTSSLTDARAHLQARGHLHPSYTYKKNQPLRLRPLRLQPSCLQTPTPSALALSALAPWALVLSWSSTAVAHRHDLTMHEKPHYQRFLSSDRRHLHPRLGPAQQRGLQRQYWMSVARHRWSGRSCDLHPTSATKLTSILGYDFQGGLFFCTTRARRGAFQLARGNTNRFRLLLRRYPHQSSTRPHTGLHTRPTHSPSKEFRLHSLNHLQELRLKFIIPFQELRLDSRASGLLTLVPSGSRALPHPGFIPYPIPGLGFILHIF